MFSKITAFFGGHSSTKTNTAEQTKYNSFFTHSPEDRVSGKLHYGAVYGVKVAFESLEHVKNFMRIYGDLQEAYQENITAPQSSQVFSLPQAPSKNTIDVVKDKYKNRDSRYESERGGSSYFERSPYDFGVWLSPHYTLCKSTTGQPSFRRSAPTIGQTTQSKPATEQISGERQPVIAFKDGYLYSNIGEVQLKLVLSNLMSQATGFKGVFQNYCLSEKMFSHLMNPENHNYVYDPKGLHILRGAFMIDSEGRVLELENPSPQLAEDTERQLGLVKLNDEDYRPHTR